MPDSLSRKNRTTPTDPPPVDQIQVSLFGPGFGESVLIHVGAGKWVIIDSCFQIGESTPAPLAYLKAIGVDPAESVELIIASHWHDDHARGLATILEACRNATFSCSMALGHEKLLVLGARYKERVLERRSGINEVIRIQNLLYDRKKVPRYAQSGQTLMRWPKEKTGLPFEVNVSALSPVDTAIQKSIKHFASLIDDTRAGETVPPPQENLTSIVVRIDVNDESLLLGSDLENSPTYGWAVLLADPRNSGRKSFVFKVAHHGSKSGHDDGIWSNFLHPTPFAFLSPFVKGDQELPDARDIERIKGLSDKAFITSDPTLKVPARRRSAAVERTIKEKGFKLWPVESIPGHIRLRFKPGDPSTQSAEAFESAYRL